MVQNKWKNLFISVSGNKHDSNDEFITELEMFRDVSKELEMIVRKLEKLVLIGKR